MRYLILTYYYKADGKIDEAMTVTRSLKTRDWQTANVILDFKECKVLKAHVKDTEVPKEWDHIVGYYYPFYTRIMERLFQENGHELPKEVSAD